MNIKTHIALIIVILCHVAGYAQKGKDASLTIAANNTIVNEYTTLLVDAAVADITIQVASSALNTNSRFSGALVPGDLIFIYQAQGASTNGYLSSWVGMPLDSTQGTITNYNDAGNYEFAEVKSVPTATSIELMCGLKNSYTVAGATQIIRVPRYASLIINNGGVLTCQAWNGSTGGIVVVEVEGTTTITTGGKIDVSGLGFRGGKSQQVTTAFGANNVGSDDKTIGADKGESIIGYEDAYNPVGGRYGKGAMANGGGGGCRLNCGGGGGANGGAPSLWNGHGIPDLSGTNFATAWNREYSWKSATTSTGGGKGGYSFSSSNQNAISLGPNQNSWGGDKRNNQGGFGGRPLDYSTGKIFFGGGGGGGHNDNGYGGAGGNGGGIVYIMSYGSVTGAGNIISNGNNGGNATGAVPGGINQYTGNDAAGGGGGGGTIIISAYAGSTGITATANGGKGGNQVLVKSSFFTGTLNEAEGPGGGGGGGYIATSGGAITQVVNGGANGTTNSAGLSEFAPNGATKGAEGSLNQSIDSYFIQGNDTSICGAISIKLRATLLGNPPAGTINWYSVPVGGSPIATGNIFTTPVLTNTTTYYVGICPSHFRIPVVVNVNPTINLTASSTGASCSAGGTLTATATGGSGGFVYTWTNNSTAATQNNIAAGLYTVTVTDIAGCTETAVTVITGTAGSLSFNPPVVTDVLCKGQLNGSIVISPTGGSATYSYKWNNSATGATNSNLKAGIYSVTVTDLSGGCSATASITVTEPALLVINTLTSAASCAGNDGEASVTITGGGTPGFTYSWMPGNYATSTITGLTAGSYTVTVTDLNGCTKNRTANVVSAGGFSAQLLSVTDVLCFGDATGAASVIATGGTPNYNYTWSGSASNTSTVTGLLAGGHTVTVTDAAGCSNLITFNINQPTSLPSITSITKTPSSCVPINGTATANATGGTPGYNYNWTSTSTKITATGLAPGAYTVTVTDANGCSVSQSVTIFQKLVSNPVLTASDDTICQGTSATLTASGAISYNWLPVINISSPTGSVIIATPNKNTTYTLTATDANGCTATATTSIVLKAQPSADAGVAKNICLGSTVQLTGSGGVSYNWSPPTGLSATTVNVVDATPTDTTVYTLTVTDATGCTATATVAVNVTPIPIADAGSDFAICNGATSFLFAASGAASYSWSPTTGVSNPNIKNPQVSPTITTDYIVTASRGPCSAKDTVKVTVNNLPTITANADSEICNGDVFTLSANGGDTYSWLPAADLNNALIASPKASPSLTATYTVTGTDVNGCSSTATTTLTVNPLPIASITGDLFICTGQSATLVATGGVSYNWSEGSTGSTVTLNPVATTNYSVTVIDAKNCTATSNVDVTVSTIPVASAGNDTSICIGTPAQLSGGTGLFYTWSPSTGLSDVNSSNPSASPVVTTKYALTVSNGNSNCATTDTVLVTVVPLPIASAGSDRTIIIGQSTTLVGTGGVTYNWSPTTGLNAGSGSFVIATPKQPTTYTVIVSDALGCTSIAAVTVDIDFQCGEVFVPSGFTPNGDGQNDILYVRGNCITDLSFVLFDRWGQQVFSTSNKDNGWDGSYNGNPANTATFTYSLKANLLNGKKVEMTGNVSLVR